MTARYTTAELLRLAQDRGPFAVDNMRQALTWAAATLEAAGAAVTAERELAEAALAGRKPPLTADEVLTEFCKTPGMHQFISAFSAGVMFAERHHHITQPNDPRLAGRT